MLLLLLLLLLLSLLSLCHAAVMLPQLLISAAATAIIYSFCYVCLFAVLTGSTSLALITHYIVVVLVVVQFSYSHFSATSLSFVARSPTCTQLPESVVRVTQGRTS